MRYVLFLALLLCSCELFSSLPGGAERFDPPAIYREWWSFTEECSGITGDYDRVNWYRIPGDSSFPVGNGSDANAAWDHDGNRIIIAGSAVFAGDLVRHEMLHALLQASGHPRDAFITHCDGTVVCTDRCILDAGAAPPPDPEADSVAPTVLTVHAEVIPSAPSSSISEGAFMMIVTAMNTTSAPVIIRSPRGGFGPVTYEFRIFSRVNSSDAEIQAEAPEETRFAPLETKKFIFDFHVGAGPTRYDLTPDQYTIIASYADQPAEAIHVLVSP